MLVLLPMLRSRVIAWCQVIWIFLNLDSIAFCFIQVLRGTPRWMGRILTFRFKYSRNQRFLHS